MSARRISAFTLVEVMIAVVIASLLLLWYVANGTKNQSMAELSTMKVKAQALNDAQVHYLEANGVAAGVSTFSAQTTDDARYQLLRPYIPFSPATLTSYVLAGFTITFNSDPRQPVTLMQGSTTITYN